MSLSRATQIRHALTLALAIVAFVAARSLPRLQDELGPRRQHVNVRFRADVSDETREAFEQQRGLVAGEDKGTRTWTYLLTDQSADNIRELVRSPLVEDTAHIDRNRLSVELDLPNLPAWVRELLFREQLAYGSWLLVAAGLVLAWSTRRSVIGWIAVIARWMRHAARKTPPALMAMDVRVERWTQRRELLVAFALCVFYLTPILWHGPTDDEEIGLGLFSSQIYYRDLLLHGRWSYWFTDLGFGTPMPLGQRLDFHPLFALGSLISLRVALTAVWLVQLGVMAVYFLRLLRPYGLTPRVRLVLLGLYVFSLASFLLFFTTDWVSCQIPWTLYPVLVYYIREAVMGGAAARWWLTTLRLGLLLSVWVLNAHPGYLTPLFIVLAVYTVVAAPRTLAVYGSIATAGALAFAASAERMYFLVHEAGLFPPNSNRVTQLGYSVVEFLTTQTGPLVEVRSGRQPYVGAVVFCAALAAPALWRTADRHVRGCIVAFFAALALSTVPVRALQWTGLSGVWLFRDPVVFFGLLSAAAVAQSVLQARSIVVRQLALGLLAFQVLQQFLLFSPGYRAHWDGNTRLEWYRHQEGHPVGVAAAVVRASERYGTRLYLSPRADALSRGVLSPGGVHVVTDYALLGLNPVNGWFKNISTDRLYPSRMMMHGYIRGERAVIENPTLLDVLGINLVVISTGERVSPDGLIPLEQIRVNEEAGAFDIFANPDAWPKAVLLSPAARQAALPRRAGCRRPGALCRDYAPLVGTRLPQDVSLREAEDGYEAHVPPSDAPRLLFLSAFYRPEWVATAAGQALTIEPIANAFIGVTVPPGVQDVRLTFRPPIRVTLTWVSWAALFGMIATLGIMGAARRFRAIRKSA